MNCIVWWEGKGTGNAFKGVMNRLTDNWYESDNKIVRRLRGDTERWMVVPLYGRRVESVRSYIEEKGVSDASYFMGDEFHSLIKKNDLGPLSEDTALWLRKMMTVQTKSANKM
jgi:hypothetical protein